MESGARASEMAQTFETVPQRLKNVRFDGEKNPLEVDGVKSEIAKGEQRLTGSGRLLIRKSGTESLIRVMGESEDPELLDDVIESVCAAIVAAQ